MNSGYPYSAPIGRITAGIELGTLANKIIDFVRQQLPAWRDHPDRDDVQSEFRLTSQLCVFLNARARQARFSMIQFHHELPQPRSRSVDLSVHPLDPLQIDARLFSVFHPVLVLECKRLPPPDPKREREYVTGDANKRSGGIQRFKLGLHGSDTDVAGMIGFLQEATAPHWHSTINGWILELCNGTPADGCTWSSDEVLSEIDCSVSGGVTSYCSVHSRTSSRSGQPITIHHVWVAMNQLQGACRTS